MRNSSSRRKNAGNQRFHAFLALTGRLNHRAVGIENRLSEDVFRLLPPGLHAGVVEDLLQRVDMLAVESMTKDSDFEFVCAQHEKRQ